MRGTHEKKFIKIECPSCKQVRQIYLNKEAKKIKSIRCFSCGFRYPNPFQSKEGKK